MRITSRNAMFQQWQALLENRSKRHRRGEFLVQGVRPINLALQHGWTVNTLIHRDTGSLSTWALDLVNSLDTSHVTMSGDLVDELAEKSSEIVAVVATKPDDLTRICGDGPVIVFDRPVSPGNIGSLIRSADAFGSSGVIITGHAADIYDPKCVRATTGSLFTVPVVRVDGLPVSWLRDRRVIGLDESGKVDIMDADLSGNCVLVVGNETTSMSTAWRDRCDLMVNIPIGGAASSLNAAAAGSIALYEASRQRRP